MGVDATRFWEVLVVTEESWMFVLTPGLGGRGGATAATGGPLIGSRALWGGLAGKMGRCSPVNWGVIGLLVIPFMSSRSLLLLATE